jgi:hypothetical protein
VIGPTCSEVRDAAAEFALDILRPHERSLIAAHLLRCPECRAEVDAMSAVGDRLLELVPGTEPPLGFDERVLARLHSDARPHRRFVNRRAPRLFAAMAAVAAAVVLVVSLSLGWFSGGTAAHSPRGVLTADFTQNGHEVGEVSAYPAPAWVDMTVSGVRGAEKVTCELLHTNGHVTTVGSFDLVDGSGRWGAPDPGGVAGISGARLVDDHGHVIATATFH